MFAKLYGPDDDQVLVMLDSDENNAPCVRFYFQPKDLGVCSFNVGFRDTDAGWDQAEAVFAGIDEENARSAVKEAIGTFTGSATQGD